MKTLDLTDENGIERTARATALMMVDTAAKTARIEIKDGYHIKEQLKERGYTFDDSNPAEKCWVSPEFDAADPRDLYRHYAELRANVAVKPCPGGRLAKAEKVWDEKIAPMLD